MIIINDIAALLARDLASYCFLKSLRIERDVFSYEWTPYTVEVVLTRILDKGSSDVHIKFTGAVDIKIFNIEGLVGMLLNIADVKADQLDGIAYRVTEEENNAFSFSCNEFHAEFS